jgi:hypothetical protein
MIGGLTHAARRADTSSQPAFSIVANFAAFVAFSLDFDPLASHIAQS